MRLKQVFHLTLLAILLASYLEPVMGVHAQTPIPPPKVQAVLASMTPEERVGQLFLVTFHGTDTSAQSQIYDLIVNHHIGGVVMLADNDNFLGGSDTLSGAHHLIGALQTLEWDATTSLSSTPDRNAYIPLFIGISQDGDG